MNKGGPLFADTISFVCSSLIDTDSRILLSSGWNVERHKTFWSCAKGSRWLLIAKERANHNMPRAPQITLNDLRERFDRPLADVASEFGVCLTYIKRLCRSYEIKRWPYRKVNVVLHFLTSSVVVAG